MEEIWKDIKGYEGLYQISNLGRVKSLRFNKEMIMKIHIPKNNWYPVIHLRKNGVSKTIKIHRIVAQTFILNPNNLPIVNHKDENKTNNCVDNLEWCSRKYNAIYGTALERAKESRINTEYYKRLYENSLKLNILLINLLNNRN